MRKVYLVLFAVLSTAGLIYFLFENPSPLPQTPDPFTFPLFAESTMPPVVQKPMPPVVEESMETLLGALEAELEKHNPDIIPSLQPGITDEELDQAQEVLGQAIHPDMQALYRWHNGLEYGKVLFPAYEYWPLEDAIKNNQDLNREFQDRRIYWLMAHEKNWLVLFPDLAGDGFYYDPVRRYETGGVFYNFREIGYYRYFPSIKNLLKAIVECYQKGVYSQDAEPDFELEDLIMDQYGVEIEGW